jgi:UDP-N-acetyl-D-galactosamine dehydrogenase
VDPYYLAHKAQALGYLPEVILAGRRINEGMGKYTAVEVVKLMIRNGQKIVGARVLVLGITFKENCPDIRCSGAAAMVRGLQEFGCLIDIYDPWADPVEVEREYGFTSKKGLASLLPGGYDAIVPVVAHREFATLDFQFYKKHDAVVFDVQGILPPEMIDERL